jgi:hypothetical protein
MFGILREKYCVSILIGVLCVLACGSCVNRRSGDAYRLHHQSEKDQRARINVSSNISELGSTLAVTSAS